MPPILALKMPIQWGSEIRPCLDFKWSKKGWFANSPVFEWDLIPEAQPFENQPKWPPSCIYHLKSRLFSPDFEWSGFLMVKARPFENRTFEINLQKVRNSDHSGFKMVDFRSSL